MIAHKPSPHAVPGGTGLVPIALSPSTPVGAGDGGPPASTSSRGDHPRGPAPVVLTFITLALLCLTLPVGCTSSPWAASFTPAFPRAAPPRVPEDAPVLIRAVPWERLNDHALYLKQRETDSDTHITEWSPAQHAEVRANLLRALQVTDDPATITVVGSSHFKTIDALNPADGTLERFARRRGSNLVVWARRYAGLVDTIIEHPTTTHTTGWRSGPRYRREHYTETSTTWVPFRVAAEEYAYTAYFLRRGP